MMFEKLQNKIIIIEVRMVAAWRGEVILIGERKEGTFWAAVNVLYLALSGGHTDEHTHKNPSSSILMTYTS